MYFFQRNKKGEFEQPSKDEIEKYSHQLHQHLPSFLSQMIPPLQGEDFLSGCTTKHLHFYLLVLEKSLKNHQDQRKIKTCMRSRYVDTTKLQLVEVKQQTLTELQETIKIRLESEQSQKAQLISQNKSLREALNAVQLKARGQVEAFLTRINQILDSHNIRRLEADLKSPYEAALKQMEAQMDLQIVGLLDQVRIQAEAKDKLAFELDLLTKKMMRKESQISELAKKYTQLQQEMYHQSFKARHKNSQIILDFWNKKIVTKISKYSEVSAEDQIITQLELNQKSKQSGGQVFQFSQILQKDSTVKDFIIESIQTGLRSKISSTRLLYRYDKHHKDFGEYLKDLNAPFSLILRLENGRVCGGFCQRLSQPGLPSFLFSYLGEGIVFSKAAGNDSRSGCSFTSNQLIFGFNELVITNNQKGREVKLNCRSFGARYFEKLWSFAEIGEGNICIFEELELHAIELDE